MAKVFIEIGPRRLKATIEVVDKQKTVLATGRFPTDMAGYAAMRIHEAAWSDPVRAIDGCNDTYRPLTQRLMADG